MAHKFLLEKPGFLSFSSPYSISRFVPAFGSFFPFGFSSESCLHVTKKKCSVQNQNLRISSISLSFQHPWIFPLEMVGTPAKEHFVFSDQIMRFTTVRLTKLVERSCIQTMRPMYLGKPRFARFSLHFQVWPWNVKKKLLVACIFGKSGSRSLPPLSQMH